MKNFNDVLAEIIRDMQKGCMPWSCPWVAKGMQPMPTNIVTNNEYSGINVLLLWRRATKQKYGKNQWLTFKQATENGIKVIKGSKSVRCLRMVAIPVEGLRNPLLQLTAQKVVEEGEERILMPKWFNLFNIEDCDTSQATLDLSESQKELIDHPSSWKIDKLNASAAAIGVRIMQAGQRAVYQGKPDIIQMPDASWNSEEDYCATLAHEIIHSSGHDSRTGRHAKIRSMFDCSDEAYAFEELVAEIGSAFFCAELGIEGQIQGHASYIAIWLKELKNKKQYLTKATFFAQQAFEYLSAATADKQNAA